MKDLSANLIIEKNKLGTSNPWVILAKITLVDPNGVEPDKTIRLARNTEDITFQAYTWTAVPFEIEPSTTTSSGEIPTVVCQISNVTRFLQADLETYGGGLSSSLTLYVVNTGHLTEDYTELTMDFDILQCTSNARWVSFTLGALNPLLQRFPPRVYATEYCSWEFKGLECAYAGAETTCDKTFATCQSYGNNSRFGGFMGLRESDFRLV